MPVRPMVDVIDAIDIHVHSAPSYTHHRPWDDAETALQAREAGMAAVVLKDHTESTVTRARLAQKAAPGVRMFGGVVLNNAVGGINPDAADVACTMGAGEIWMPTVDAARHAEVFVPGGYYDRDNPHLGPAEPEKKSRHLIKIRPITIVKDNGELTDEAKDVVCICKTWDVMLGTSHIHKHEALALAKFSKAESFKKLVITHVNWAILCNYTPQEMKALADLGAWLEFCGTAIFPPTPARTIEQEVALLKEVGTQRCILASDAGAQVFGTAPTVFRGYLQLLNNAGLPISEIKEMASERPRRLLNMMPGLSDSREPKAEAPVPHQSVKRTKDGERDAQLSKTS